MRTVKLRKILAAIAFSAFFVFGILCFMPDKTIVIAESAYKTNLLSMSDYHFPDSSWSNYFETSEGVDEEYGSFIKFRADIIFGGRLTGKKEKLTTYLFV